MINIRLQHKTIATLPAELIFLLAMFHNSFAQSSAKTFYLLPPGTKDYIEGIPYIMTISGVEVVTKPMGIDPSSDGCGWYRVIYDNETVPSEIIVGLGPKMLSPITGNRIALASKFEELESDVIYYQADTGRWLTTRVGIAEETNRCSYKFAAIIYDSDWSVMSGAFKCGEYQNTSSSTCPTPAYEDMSPVGTGINRGIPMATLDANRKMQWRGTGNSPSNNSGTAANDGWTATSFIDAFKPTLGKTIQRCYEMPFVRSSDGLWEFNSYKLCSNGQVDPEGVCSGSYGGLMGGFFPPELQTNVDSDGTVVDYSSCLTCNTTRMAETWVPLLDSINQWCFDRGWYGTGNNEGNLEGLATKAALDAEMVRACGSRSYAFAPGDLRNGDSPGIWDWDNRTCFGQPKGYAWNSCTDANKTRQKNMLFCFESHAEFVYDPAQEFFFSGDDDIWVYINNYLVVDLGGSHLAAPGYVKLDTIKTPEPLVEGEKYNIDIFFCDSRTTMSNVRIASNIYFAQTAVNNGESGLYKQTNNEICLQEVTGNTCSSLRNEGNITQTCGEYLAPRLSYKISVPGLGELYLNSDNDKCIAISDYFFICYGGIILNNGTVQINEPAITEEYLVENGFELYAIVSGYESLNLLKTEAVDPDPIIARSNPKFQTDASVARYYNIKGEPLGVKKPTKAGVYIVRQNGLSKLMVVK